MRISDAVSISIVPSFALTASGFARGMLIGVDFCDVVDNQALMIVIVAERERAKDEFWGEGEKTLVWTAR